MPEIDKWHDDPSGESAFGYVRGKQIISVLKRGGQFLVQGEDLKSAASEASSPIVQQTFLEV